MDVLKRVLELEGRDLLEISQLEKIHTNIDKVEGQARELMLLFLDESIKSFRTALSHCKEDMIWHGFILYNNARTIFFRELLVGGVGKEESWKEIMGKAIAARYKTNILIAEVLKGEEKVSYLQDHFIYQEELVRHVNLNLLFSENRSWSCSNNKLVYKGMDLNDRAADRAFLEKVLAENKSNKKRIKNYQEDLIEKILAK